MSEEKNQNEIEEVTNEDEHKDVEHYCYLCRRPESAAGKMLELPNNIFICTDCMQRTLNSMGNGQFGFVHNVNLRTIIGYHKDDERYAEYAAKSGSKEEKERQKRRARVYIKRYSSTTSDQGNAG